MVTQEARDPEQLVLQLQADVDRIPLHVALPAMLAGTARLGAESLNPDADLVEAFQGLLADARLENAKKAN